MKEIENRRIVYARFNIGLTPSINQGRALIPLYCEFQPDQVIVKSFSYICDPTIEAVVNVQTNLISQGGPLLTFPGNLGKQVVWNSLTNVAVLITGPAFEVVDSCFNVTCPISGNFLFEFQNSLGVNIDMDQTDLAICLEFVKYKK
jgi:hypothetical protein